MTRAELLDALDTGSKHSCLTCRKCKINVHSCIGDIKVAATKLSRNESERNLKTLHQAKHTLDLQLRFAREHLSLEHEIEVVLS